MIVKKMFIPNEELNTNLYQKLKNDLEYTLLAFLHYSLLVYNMLQDKNNLQNYHLVLDMENLLSLELLLF